MKKAYESLYEGKRVLVTGHTGFKGSWLALWLSELGAEVIGYALEPPTEPNMFDALNLRNRISHIAGDIRDEAKLSKVFVEYEPTIVFHMAAQALVRASYHDPEYTYQTNVMGVVSLFEAVRKSQTVKVVVNVTSDKCYQNKGQIHSYKEGDPLAGLDPYSSSKACSEIVTMAYRNSFFATDLHSQAHDVAVASARAGNVIGGGDWADDRLIPDCVKAFAANRVIDIRYPKSTRPWQHVLEPLSGYLWLAASMFTDTMSYNQAWNFGPSGAVMVSVRDVVDLLIEQWGGGEYRLYKTDDLHEAHLLNLDVSKSNHILKWKPIYSVNEAVKETAAWYKAFYCGSAGDISSLTISQINKYVDRARTEHLPWAKGA